MTTDAGRWGPTCPATRDRFSKHQSRKSGVATQDTLPLQRFTGSVDHTKSIAPTLVACSARRLSGRYIDDVHASCPFPDAARIAPIATQTLLPSRCLSPQNRGVKALFRRGGGGKDESATTSQRTNGRAAESTDRRTSEALRTAARAVWLSGAVALAVCASTLRAHGTVRRSTRGHRRTCGAGAPVLRAESPRAQGASWRGSGLCCKGGVSVNGSAAVCASLAALCRRPAVTAADART